MTEARDILVYPYNGSYVVIGGNMRLQAYKYLGWTEVPCCILPENMPVEKLRQMLIQDNNPFGENDWDALANEWDSLELEEWGFDVWQEPKEDKQLKSPYNLSTLTKSIYHPFPFIGSTLFDIIFCWFI